MTEHNKYYYETGIKITFDDRKINNNVIRLLCIIIREGIYLIFWKI